MHLQVRLTIEHNRILWSDALVDNGTTALNVAASTVGGNLTLTSGHASGITDSGTVTVGGNLVATTDANSGVINLGTLAVDGTVALTTNGSGNATLVNDTGSEFRGIDGWRESVERNRDHG